MDEGKRTKRNIWNDDDEDELQQPKKRRALWGVLGFFLILIVVLGVVLLAAYRDGTGFDVLRRYLHYGSAEESGGEPVYDYDADPGNQFAVLEKHLVVLSDTGLKILSPDEKTIWSTALNLKAPALDAGNTMAVAYDVGGTVLYVVNAYGEVMRSEADPEEPIIAASLNEHDWLSITTEKRNYKGCVQVYDPEMELAFVFNSSSRFVMDACVVGEGEKLAAVTLGQEDSAFVSNVVLYDLHETEPYANYSIENGLVLGMDAEEDRIVTVSDTCLTCANANGKIVSTHSYGREHLREYHLAGDGFAVLLLSRYQSGSLGRLLSVGTDGTQLGSLDVKEEILDISAAGRYLAVLYADRVVVYNPDLQVYASLTGIDQARGVLMRPDGSVLLLGAESAHLFLP